MESFLSSIAGHKASPGTNHTSLTPVTSTAEFGQTMKTGTLLRKERLKWSHCHCLIRNSFLECHKSNATTMGKPLLKLLLLGSEVLPLQVSSYLCSYLFPSLSYSFSLSSYFFLSLFLSFSLSSLLFFCSIIVFRTWYIYACMFNCIASI